MYGIFIYIYRKNQLHVGNFEGFPTKKVQKSGDHQLRLVIYPIIYRVLAPSQVVVWDFFHRQYLEPRKALRKSKKKQIV